MAVGLLDGRADRCPNVREKQTRGDVTGELAQVLVVPGRLDAVEHARLGLLVVPADPKAVTVGRLRTELRVEALVDQRVGRRV